MADLWYSDCDDLTFLHAAALLKLAHDFLFERYFYIVTNEGMLLIGGASVNGGNETEELIPLNNEPNEPAFSLDAGRRVQSRLTTTALC